MAEQKNESIIQAIKFTIFSFSAGLIQIGSFTLLETLLQLHLGNTIIFDRALDLDYAFNYTVSLVLSVIWNFTINRKFTFKSSSNVPIAMLKVALFYLVFTPTTMIGGSVLTGTLHWNHFIVEGLTMVLNFVLEFLYDKYFVFRDALKKPNKTVDPK